MSRSSLPSNLRAAILIEAAGRCACDPTRHIDTITAGVGELEVHHIVPWRIVRQHDPANLVALCRSCHARADRGIITQWVLKQLKRASLFHHGDGEESAVRDLLEGYLSKGGHVLGEGYSSAATFVEFTRRHRMSLARQLALVRDIAPPRRDPALILSLLYLELDLTSHAIEILRLCLDTSKRTTRYMRMMGNALSRAGKYELGHRWFSQSAAWGDRSLALHCNWGDCMIYIGHRAASSRAQKYWFNRALNILNQVRSEDPALLFNKGRVLKLLGETEAAATCFIRATEIGKQYPLPFVELGLLYAFDGRRSDALRAFDEAVRRRPRRLGFLLSAARFALEWGEIVRSRQYLAMFESEERYFDAEEAVRVIRLRKQLGISVERTRRRLTWRCP